MTANTLLRHWHCFVRVSLRSLTTLNTVCSKQSRLPVMGLLWACLYTLRGQKGFNVHFLLKDTLHPVFQTHKSLLGPWNCTNKLTSASVLRPFCLEHTVLAGMDVKLRVLRYTGATTFIRSGGSHSHYDNSINIAFSWRIREFHPKGLRQITIPV